MTDTIEPVKLVQDENTQIARTVVAQARASGVDLVGPDGLLVGLTEQVLELALEEELTVHLGYPPGEREG
jgi:transposase-like protein